MRTPPLLVATALLAATLSSAPPASAADATIVVNAVFPPGAGLMVQPCGAYTDAVSDESVSISRLDPSLGTRSFAASGYPAGSAAGLYLDTTSPVIDPVATLDVLATAGTSAVLRVVYEKPGVATTFWEGKATPTVPASPAWQTVDAGAATYTWTQRFTLGSSPTGATPPAPSTLAAFMALPGNGDAPVRFGFGLGCAGESVQFDRLRVGHAGSVITYDVEGYLTTTAASAARTIAAGQSTTLTTSVATNDPDVSIANGGVTLERLDGAGYVPLGAVPFDAASGQATATVAPAATTTYRWSFLERDCCLPSVSVPFTVTVTPAAPTAYSITGTPAKKKVTRGKRIMVTGQATPAQPGAIVTLFQEKGATDKPLGTAVVGTDGRFSLKVKAKKPGKLTLYVATPAAASTPFTVKVKPKR